MNDLQKMLQWRIIEDLQDNHPHLRFGWYGIIPMIYENDLGVADIHMGKL